MKTRAWKLFNLLMKEDRWLSKEEICLAISEYEYHEKCWDKCVAIWEDMNEINNSLEVDKIVVLKNQCFKIGSKEEVESFRNKQVKKLLKQLDKIKAFDKKIDRNDQGKLLSNQNKAIGEDSKAKLFYETFLKE